MSLNKASGFTLIELLVVIVIIATVTSLVGGFTVDRLDKMRQKNEVMSLQRLIDKEAFLAFSRGEAIRLEFQGKGMYRQLGEQPQALIKQFGYIAFDNQQLAISKTGYLMTPELSYFADGQSQQIRFETNMTVENYAHF